MDCLIIIGLIFLGLIFGSFGSVIFYRLGNWPTKETWKGFLVGRSECPHCHHTLKAKNLVPIFSYLFQGGKCEYCKSPISGFYPFLEISTVIIFVGLFLLLGKYGILNHPIGLKEGYIYMSFILVSAWLLRLIFLYDIKTYELHITATIFLAVISLFFTLFFGVNRLEILLGIGIFTLVFLIIYYLSKIYVRQKYEKDVEGFGLGDVLIAPILGAWLVFFLKPNGMFDWCYLVCSFIILAGLVGLLYYAFEFLIRHFVVKNNKKSEKPYGFQTSIPFLPSMIIGFLLEISLRDIIISMLYF